MKKNKMSIVKYYLLLILFCLSFLAQSQGAGSEATNISQLNAARDLIKRTLPSQASHFKLEIIENENGLDVFEIESLKDKIVLRGSSGVAISSAFYWYLKHYCGCDLSWCGDQLDIPQPLPRLKEKIRKVSLHKYRVYFNYCTLNYTAAFWDWKRWEREIDFMAMNGINMPLSVIGLEGTWYNTLLKYGFTDLEARSFLVGPPYFAWQWMTNIQSHGGPLPKKWIDRRIGLGQKILKRQRELGMHPIQQGFSGYVPRELRKKYPKAEIAQKRDWVGFEGTCQLDPLDPLFHKFGKTFFEENIKLFGKANFYAADPFHEGEPPKPGKEYLKKVGLAIYELMKEVNPDACWVMQSWSLRKEIACAVPKDHLLILDLNGAKWTSTENFWGYDFVKGQLHNFGGRINMHGDLQDIARNPFAKTAEKVPNCKGMGLFMEAIEQNPVFYQMVFDMIWRNGPVVPIDWLEEYSKRRYGAKSLNAEKAWKILLENPYRPGTSGTEKSSMVAARPAVNVKKSGPNAGFKIPYDPKKLLEAWELLLKDYKILGKSDAYKYDIIDIGRQVLSNVSQELHKDAAMAFKKKDIAAFDKASKAFLELLDDLDSMLGTRDEFCFGRWTDSARKWGDDEKEKMYYEWNANMLVTVWGPVHNPKIFDYSWREWSGLIKHFYKERWIKFYDFLGKQLDEGKEYKDPKVLKYGREAFRANDFYNKLGDWELAWIKEHHDIPAKSSGDSVQTALVLLEKYKPVIGYAYSPKRLNEHEQYRRKSLEGKLGKYVGSWTPKVVSRKGNELLFDISKLIEGQGEYKVIFLYKKGHSKLEISYAAILQDGVEISKDKHFGSTGRKNKNNTYSLKIPSLVFTAKYQFKAKVATHGGNNSYGEIWLKKKTH